MEKTSPKPHVINLGANPGLSMYSDKSREAGELGSREGFVLPGLVTWRLSGSHSPYL